MFLKPQNKAEIKKATAASALLQSLVRMQHSLYKKETQDWITARESALDLIAPNHYDLVQFYRDIDTDLFIKGCKNQRINRIKNRKIKVVSNNSGVTNLEKTKLLQSKWFRDFVQVVMESKFNGFRLIYFTKDAKGRPVTNYVWPEHVIPQKGIIVRNPFDTEGVSYLQPPLVNYFIPVGNPDSLGMYENLAYAYILRKHSWASWDEFEELFGVPLRWISTTATDKGLLDTLEQFALTMGSSNYAIVPGDAKMEVKEGQTQDAFQVFNEKRKAVNEEVSIFINGNAEQINEKGSRGKSETVISNTQDQITADDKQDVIDIINNELLPTLNLLFNMGFGDDDVVEWDDTTRLAPKEKAEIYKSVNDMGFELDAEEVATELGVGIIGKKEVKKVPGTEPDKKETDPKKIKAQAGYATYIKLHADLLAAYNHLEEGV